MDRPAKRRRPNGRGRPRRAVKIDPTHPLRGKKGPGVVRRRIRVVERDAVEVDVVVAVREAAKISLRLAQASAVAVGGEGARRHLHSFAVVGQRRGEVGDKRLGDLSPRRVLVQ